jgi:hypothetical protein
MISGLLSCAHVTMTDSRTIPFTRQPLGLAYASDGVNASIFRTSSVISAGDYQFAAYYAPDGRVVVARRSIANDNWDLAVQEFKGHVTDAHNDVVLGISPDGFVHLAYDHHSDPLHYRVSAEPYDIHHFGPLVPMTGENESHVTYPQFISAPDGSFYFFYRDGASGNGTLCLNRYNPATKSWSTLHHPLIDGENKCNPYWWRPAIGADNSIHLFWCWRDTPDASTNHDLCYAQSNDGGHTWLRSDRTPQPLPITPENAEIIVPISKGSNLINQCSSAIDPAGHPHAVQYMNDPVGIPQYFDVWFDGTRWHTNQVSHRTETFSLQGKGSLSIPISRPEIAISQTGTVSLITRDSSTGGGIRLYQAAAPFDQWNTIDVTHEDLGNWEPTYDLPGFRQNGILSLFVLRVQQGNHEMNTDFPPQQACILQFKLP